MKEDDYQRAKIKKLTKHILKAQYPKQKEKQPRMHTLVITPLQLMMAIVSQPRLVFVALKI